jgi:hypothetical protein
VQDSQANDVDMLSQEQGALADGEMEEGEERENPSPASAHRRTTSTLNPQAAEFQPRMSAASLLKDKVLRGGYDSSTPGPGSPAAGSSPSTYPTDSNLDRDVEMGDIQPSTKGQSSLSYVQDPNIELEEGETSENSSLTPPPD